jgi:hypothetical protein
MQWPQMQPDSPQKVRLENTTNPWQSPQSSVYYCKCL